VSATALFPLLLVLIVLTSAIWVYTDASRQIERGTPVVFSYGTFRLDTPSQWFPACVFVWILFFPLYLVGRRA
jgi:hypothetical protein